MYVFLYVSIYECMQEDVHLPVHRINNAVLLMIDSNLTGNNANYSLNQKQNFIENVSFIYHVIAIYMPTTNMPSNATYMPQSQISSHADMRKAYQYICLI